MRGAVPSTASLLTSYLRTSWLSATSPSLDFSTAAPVASLGHLLRSLLAGEEGVVGVVVLPLAVAAGQHDVLRRQPLADQRHVLGRGVVVDDVGDAACPPGCRPDRIVRLEEADLVAVLDAALDQVVAVARAAACASE